MAFPVSPTNGQITEINGINYQFVAADSAWVRVPGTNLTVGNLTANNITSNGNVTASSVYTTNGLFWSGNGVAFSSGSGSGLTYTAGTAPPISGNVTGDQWYNTVTDVLFEYLDNGVSQYWVDIQTSVIAANAVVTIPELIQANLGAYQLYANANIGTLYLGNVSTNANLGAYQLDTNANIGTLFLGNASTNANLGAFQTYANANIGTLFLGNASTNANIGSFQNYANTKIGTNTNSNLVVVATTISTSTTTGALVVKGGAGIAGTLNTGNVNVTYTPVTAIGSAIQITGKDTVGGTGYFDFLKITNTTSGATNPNKNFRLTSTGVIEIINSTYGGLVFSLTDDGGLNTSGSISIAGKKAVNGPAFRAYVATGQTITSGSQQKVTFGTETFDSDGCFASSRFTPTVEGYYQLNATVRISGTASTGEYMLVIWKNGTEYARGHNGSGTEIGSSFYSLQVSDIAYANGTGDFFEIYIQQTSGGNRDTTAGAPISYFSGCMIRGA